MNTKKASDDMLVNLTARCRMAEPHELRALAELALGRVFGMLLRPYKPGDLETYSECRAVVLEVSEELAQRGGERRATRRCEPHAMTSLYKPPARA